jgi:hypothetical protein
MVVVAAAIPLLMGKGEQWRRWTQELLGSRRSEYAASRQRLGIHLERCWTGTVQGVELVFVYLEVEDPVEMCTRLARSSHPFDRWYREKLRELFGLNITQHHRGLLLEEVFVWPGYVPGSGTYTQESE